MWFQIGIGLAAAVGWLCWKKHLLRIAAWENAKLRHRMLLLIICGSILGLSLTIMEGNERGLTEEERKIPKEKDLVIREYDAIVDGQRESLEIQIPMRASEEGGQESDQEIEKQEKSMEEKIQESIEEWNKDKLEEEYYELPGQMEGMEIQWMYPRRRNGLIITLIAVVVAIGLYFLEKQQEQKAKEERKEALLRDYPGLLTKLALLVQAGLTVRMAVKRIAEDYKKVRKKGRPRAGYEELLLTYQEIESGVAEAAAYENLGSRAGELRYKTLSTLLVQSLRKGSNSLEVQLEREAADAFEERKRMARILGEKASTKLLFPMILMLMVVLGLIMIPALLSFYGGKV